MKNNPKIRPVLFIFLILVMGAFVFYRTAGIGLRFLKTFASTPTKKAVYYCPMHPTYTSDRPGDCPICSMKLVKREDVPSPSQEEKTSSKHICYLHQCPMIHEGKPCPMLVVAGWGEKVHCPVCGTHVVENPGKTRKILYWTDPMLPGYKSDQAGKSPMGMDLIPVYEEDKTGAQSPEGNTPSGYTPILLTPQRQQLIGVKTAKAVRQRLAKTIRTVGTVAHDPEFYQVQAEYLQTLQALEKAKQSPYPEIVQQAEQLVESARIRLKHLGVNEETIQEIAARKTPEHSLLYAQPGEPVWVYAQVYEFEVPLLRAGQEILAEAPSLPGETWRGRIRSIDPMVESMTRTTRVRIQIENPQGLLKPDMYLNITLVVDLGEVLAVPEEAVFDSGTKKIVFVAKEEGLLEPRDVTVGVKTEGFYEVKAGVAEGESVVTSGNFLIDSESRLKAALQGVGGGGHQHG